MSVKRFVPIKGGGPILDKLQDLLSIILDALQEDRVANDHLVSTVTDATGKSVPLVLSAGVDTRVYHGLGQAMQTWDIVRQNAAALVWEGGPSLSPTTYFNLTASATVTVTVRCT